MSVNEDQPIWIIEEQMLVNSIRVKGRTEEVMQTVKIKVINFRKTHTFQLRSPDFILKSLNYSSWYLTLDPKIKESKTNIDYISVYLHLKENNNYERFNGEIAKFQLSLIDSKGVKSFIKRSGHLYFSGLFGWGFKYFVKRNTFLEKFKRTRQTTYEFGLWLGISLVEDKELTSNNELKIVKSVDQCIRNDVNFKFNHDLINDKEYCDIKFIVEGLEIKAHSRLLASKSSKFESLFFTNESFNKAILITNFEAEVFYELITFIYKGYAPNIEKYCDQLLIAAHYYEIPQLKTMCDKICFRELTPEMAIDVLYFALKYEAFSLKVRTICYIAIHLNQVIKSSQIKWNQFKKDNQLLIQEIVTTREMKCQCSQHEFSII